MKQRRIAGFGRQRRAARQGAEHVGRVHHEQHQVQIGSAHGRLGKAEHEGVGQRHGDAQAKAVAGRQRQQPAFPGRGGKSGDARGKAQQRGEEQRFPGQLVVCRPGQHPRGDGSGRGYREKQSRVGQPEAQGKGFDEKKDQGRAEKQEQIGQEEQPHRRRSQALAHLRQGRPARSRYTGHGPPPQTPPERRKQRQRRQDEGRAAGVDPVLASQNGQQQFGQRRHDGIGNQGREGKAGESPPGQHPGNRLGEQHGDGADQAHEGHAVTQTHREDGCDAAGERIAAKGQPHADQGRPGEGQGVSRGDQHA